MMLGVNLDHLAEIGDREDIGVENPETGLAGDPIAIGE
jgi:hypothetical protein